MRRIGIYVHIRKIWSRSMRIPFPHSLSIGTDIIHLTRLSKSPTFFRKLVLRILQPVEQRLFYERFPNLSKDTASTISIIERKQREWLGGRWAAKEAAKKAWGASLLSFRDLRVETTSDGNLLVICALLEGGESGQLFDEQVAKLSLSHDGEYATATVLASPLQESIIAELRRRKSEAERNVNMTPQEKSNNDEAS